MQAKQPAVYILASGRNGTLYVGVTSDLVARAWPHRNGSTGGFTARYGVHHLVHFELHGDMEHVIPAKKMAPHPRGGGDPGRAKEKAASSGLLQYGSPGFPPARE